jgi:hypothetical protein
MSILRDQIDDAEPRGMDSQERPNKALQLTANPLRGLSAAELGR